MKLSNKKIICPDVKGNKHFYNINQLAFRPSVYGILIEKNKVLLVKQKGGYDFPGGGIKINETIEQALKREFFEETGIRVKTKQLIHAATNFFTLGYYTKKFKPVNAILLYYTCQKISGKLSNNYLTGDEKLFTFGPEWIDLKHITKIKYENAVNSVEIIKKALKLK
jgi:8-oxo-dGTP pyrophosphatase MutT (NUDIX family)